MSVTFGLAKSRHFYHILLYMSMCIFVYIFFYINNTAKGNTSLMLNKLLLLLSIYLISAMCYTYYSTYYSSIFCLIYYRVVVKINLYQCQCQCQYIIILYIGKTDPYFL